MALTPTEEAAVRLLIDPSTQFSITEIATFLDQVNLTATTAIEVEKDGAAAYTTLAELQGYLLASFNPEINQILALTSPPDAGDGSDGDFAYDTTNYVFYGPKDSGAWPAGISIQGPAGTVAIGTTTTLPDGSNATVANSGTPTAAVLDFGIPAGPEGTAATIAVGTVSSVANGQPPTVANSGTSNAAVFDFGLPEGPTGPGATISVGTVTGLANGQNPTVANSGTATAAVFDFGIPAGDTGAAATIAIGTTTTLPPGDNATVGNSGTSGAAVINFGIPQGPPGVDGIATGSKVVYSTGTVDANGEIGGTTTLSIYENDRDGNTLPLGGIISGSIIQIFSETNSANYSTWVLTADLVLASSVYSAAATRVDGGAIAEGINCRMLVIPAGATGPTGITPDITITSRLEPNANPDLTVNESGTPEFPSFELPVVTGASGSDGNDAQNPIYTYTTRVEPATGGNYAIVATGTYPNINLEIPVIQGDDGIPGNATFVRADSTAPPMGNINTLWVIEDLAKTAYWDPAANGGSGAWIDNTGDQV